MYMSYYSNYLKKKEFYIKIYYFNHNIVDMNYILF